MTIYIHIYLYVYIYIFQQFVNKCRFYESTLLNYAYPCRNWTLCTHIYTSMAFQSAVKHILVNYLLMANVTPILAPKKTSSDYMAFKNRIRLSSGYEFSFGRSIARVGRLGADRYCYLSSYHIVSYYYITYHIILSFHLITSHYLIRVELLQSKAMAPLV